MQFLLDEKKVTKSAYLLIGLSTIFGLSSILFYTSMKNLWCIIALIFAIGFSIGCAVLTSKHAIATKDDDCLLASLRSGFGTVLTAIYLVFLVFSLLTNLSDTIFQTFSILLLLMLVDLLVIEIELVKNKWFLILSAIIIALTAITYYNQLFTIYNIIYAILGIALIVLAIRNIINRKYIYFSVVVVIFELILVIITLFFDLQYIGYLSNCIEFLSFNFMLIGAIKFTNGIKSE